MLRHAMGRSLTIRVAAAVVSVLVIAVAVGGSSLLAEGRVAPRSRLQR